MTVAEHLLRRFCYEPKAHETSGQVVESPPRDPLAILKREYPGFESMVADKRVVDFGCGMGHQSKALAGHLGCDVLGVDNNLRTLEKAIELAQQGSVEPGRLRFVAAPSAVDAQAYDFVISQNSFEHFADPDAILQTMSGLLKPSGKILLTFGPPWLAPYGAHMQFFCRLPWVNVLFSEETVMRVRASYRHDGARRYEDVESGLNKMTIARFEAIVSSCGLTLDRAGYRCVRGWDGLGRVPYVREFFINHVTAILGKAS